MREYINSHLFAMAILVLLLIGWAVAGVIAMSEVTGPIDGIVTGVGFLATYTILIVAIYHLKEQIIEEAESRIFDAELLEKAKSLIKEDPNV